ncbi:hypothetical protein, partial [Leeuwenhoekiella marinoflava]|uniref:hypothetical protein n=1 Tax=Leeuwenhoekiella marinoflava TaxID=988 RepID=UPI0019D4E336
MKDAKESNLNFITKSPHFQCAVLSVKAAANIQLFLFIKQIKFEVFFSLSTSNFSKNLPAFLVKKPEGKDTILFLLPTSFSKTLFYLFNKERKTVCYTRF